MRTFRFVMIALLMLALAACSAAGEAAVSLAPEMTPTAPPATATPPPTATPLPPVGVFLAPEGADPRLVEELQAFLAQAIPESGLRFQVRPSLTAEMIAAEDIRWVIAVPPTPDLAALAAAAPQTRFLAVGVAGVAPTDNLSVIGDASVPLDQQGFMAGFTAALITPEWRVGVIGVSDSEAAQLARRAFLVGVQYYCGLCRPNYPPFFEYPLYIQLDSTASQAEWQTAADFLIRRGVETVYLVPGAGDESLRRYLAQAGTQLIGGEIPLEDVRANWVATFGFSVLDAFYEFWPQFAAGAAGQSVLVPLSLSEVNPDLLSPGKQRVVEEVMADVAAGYIETVSELLP